LISNKDGIDAMVDGIGRKMYFSCSADNEILTEIGSSSYIEEGSFKKDQFSFGIKMEFDGSQKLGWFRGTELHGYGKYIRPGNDDET